MLFERLVPRARLGGERARRCQRRGGDGFRGHRRAGVRGSDVRGKMRKGALVDRVGGGAETRRVRRLRRHHLRGSLVRRLLGEFHRVGRSPSFLSNLRRVPRRRRRRQRLGAVSKLLAQQTRLARLVIAVERVQRVKGATRLALTAGSAPVGQRQHAGVRGTRQRQSVVPDGLPSAHHAIVHEAAPFVLGSLRTPFRRAVSAAAAQRRERQLSVHLRRIHLVFLDVRGGGGVVRRRRPAVDASAREDTPRHERRHRNVVLVVGDGRTLRADRFGFETLRGRGGFQLRRFDFGIVFGIVSGIDFGTDGPLRLRARRRDWDLVRLRGLGAPRSVANLEKGHHPLRARRVVGDGDGRVPRLGASICTLAVPEHHRAARPGGDE